jgi:nucleoside-diphosphate-sugar epimerase
VGEIALSEVLVTGYTGFIGRAVTSELLKRGYKVCGVSKDRQLLPQDNLRQVSIDLLSETQCEDFFTKNKFDRMIHLAWFVGPKCHIANINMDWVQSSIGLLNNFYKNGGKVFQCNGTVSEYDFSYGYLTEDKTPLENASLHGVCKSTLYKLASHFCKQNGISFKWPRIFNLYGPNEKPQRLMPSVINSCLKGEDVKVSDCLKFQDYLHVEDTARGIVDVFESNIQGAVNICSGQPVQLRTIVNKIAELTGFKGNILWGAVPAAFGDDVVVGNNEKLKSLGWKPKYTLEEGLEETINWWKQFNKED